MTDFRVTRELAQELAETGSVQLPKDLLPDAHELSEMLGCVGGKLTTVTSDYQDFVKLGIFPDIVDVAEQFLDVCYQGQVDWIKLRQQAFTSKTCETGKWHKDAHGDLRGLSFLYTAGQDDKEALVTGGRGDSPRSHKRYLYKNGPIALAQTDFGALILPTYADIGATWHHGDRPQASRTGVLDFLF